MPRARAVDRLAVFGAKPAFPEQLHVGRPNVPGENQLVTLLQGILKRRWLTNRGPLVREFEERLAAFLNVRNAIATCNGTIALELAERALGLSGEVIVPSFTFVATAHSLQWQGIKPVFCDIDPHTHSIDPARIEELITQETTGIVGVHLWGRACAVEALSEIAERHGLHLLFDAAHAFGCSHLGRMIGGFGEAEVFSFHATKFFNTFEGGAIATNDDGLAEKLRLMKNFGFSGMDRVDHIGINGKMTEISAAMGLVGLESMEATLAATRDNYYAYCRYLGGVPGVSVLEFDDHERCNYQYVVVELEKGRCGLSRDQLLSVLLAENVRARRYFWPGCHRLEPYRTLYPEAARSLQTTEDVGRRVIVLPTGTALGDDDVELVCGIIRCALENPGPVAEAVGDSPLET